MYCSQLTSISSQELTVTFQKFCLKSAMVIAIIPQMKANADSLFSPMRHHLTPEILQWPPHLLYYLKIYSPCSSQSEPLNIKINSFYTRPLLLKTLQWLSFSLKRTPKYFVLTYTAQHYLIHSSSWPLSPSLTALYPPSSAWFLQWQLVLHWPRERSATC